MFGRQTPPRRCLWSAAFPGRFTPCIFMIEEAFMEMKRVGIFPTAVWNPSHTSVHQHLLGELAIDLRTQHLIGQQSDFRNLTRSELHSANNCQFYLSLLFFCQGGGVSLYLVTLVRLKVLRLCLFNCIRYYCRLYTHDTRCRAQRLRMHVTCLHIF